MKKQVYHACVIGMMALALTVVSPNEANATTLDLNGEVIETSENDKDVSLVDGTTMISDSFLEDELYLTVEKKGKHFSLSNAAKDFTIKGTIGKNALTFNDEKVTLATPASEQEGTLYLPLRPVLELFGTVNWNGDEQRVTVRYDYNDQLDIPLADMAKKSMDYDIPVNSGIGVDETMKPILTTDKGNIYEKYDDNGNLVGVGPANKAWIKPLHEGNVIHRQSYAIEDDYLYWIEYPDPSVEASDEQNWYLYLWERKEGAEPICIDQGIYNDLKSIQNGDGVLYNCDFENGNIIWLHADNTSGKVEVRLYQHGKKETQVLDSLPFDQKLFASVTFEVAIGDNDAFWTRANFMEAMREYGTMYRVHLDTEKIEPFSQGYNLLNPKIIGDNLVIRMKQDGHNFIPDTDHGSEYISGELAVYDLKTNKWKFKVDNSLPVIDKESVIYGVVPLNDTHMTVTLEGSYNQKGMAIVDLENGIIYEAVNDKGEVLPYSPYDTIQKAIVEVHSEGENGSCMMIEREINDGKMNFTARPVYFKW